MYFFEPKPPKKKLGQHFLNDPNIAQQIIELLQAKKCSAIIEIGPGKGALTHWLVNHHKKPLYLIEIDKNLAQGLKKHYTNPHTHIITADFLHYSLDFTKQKPIALIGNFPYNISSQIFFKLLAHRHQVKEIVCMVQKEVAHRICAQPRNKTYGILSVFLQTFYNTNYHFTVPPSAFTPPPKVHSGVIRLLRKSNIHLPCHEDAFFTLVKTAFAMRRKTLRNNLKKLHKPLYKLSNELLNQRAEELSYDIFIHITQSLYAD